MEGLDQQKRQQTRKTQSILVLGATGATGRHVVKQVLDRSAWPPAEGTGGDAKAADSNHHHHQVTVIVRSEERFWQSLTSIRGGDDDDDGDDNDDWKNRKQHPALTIVESASLYPPDLTDTTLVPLIQQANVIVLCLGHSLSLKGIWGSPRRLVTDMVQRITKLALAHPPTHERDGSATRFILMSSDGVVFSPTDRSRTYAERIILTLLRILLPPHADNEDAAAYLAANHPHNPTRTSNLEWVVIRPTNLVQDLAPSKSPGGTSTHGRIPYQVYPRPPGTLFQDSQVSRNAVAQFMVDLIESDSLWNTHRFQMPVVHAASSNVTTDTTTTRIATSGDDTSKEL